MSQEHLKIVQLKDTEWQSVEFGTHWNPSLARSAKPSIFSSWDWAIAWWSIYGDQTRSCVLACYDESSVLIGIAPLYLTRERMFGILPYRTVNFLSDHSVGSEYLGLISAPSVERKLATAVLRHLFELKEPLHLFRLAGLREDTPSDLSLMQLVRRCSGQRNKEVETCNSIRLPQDYEEYLKTLSKNFRGNVRKQTNRICKNFQARLIITQSKDQIDPHLERLFELHTRRWAQRKLPGSFRTEKKRAFYRDVSLRFLNRGWLLFFHLELDGVIRASRFGFRYADTYYALQSGFDVDFDPRYPGLGVVLEAMTIQYCIAQGLSEYDFLGGVEDYKTRWDPQNHTTTLLDYYPSSVKSFLLFNRRVRFGQLKKNLKRKILGDNWNFDEVRSRLFWNIRQTLQKKP